MDIIAHRGLWRFPEEKNTMRAFVAAIEKGFGIETDLRDYEGKLVISHDIADSNCIDAELLFKYYHESKTNVVLALNVKADGIQHLLIPLLRKYEICNYFLFDMSIPEFVVNVKEKLNVFTRHSDIENECVLYNDAIGVWMDSFYDDDWLSMGCVMKHISNNKKVCIVSPELHKKSHTYTWNKIRGNLTTLIDNIYLCTDLPEEAEEYFNECSN